MAGGSNPNLIAPAVNLGATFGANPGAIEAATNRLAGYAPGMQPRVSAPAIAQMPAMPAAQGNVFQQAAGAQAQAQQALGGLANMQFSPMQAAQMGPAATMQSVGQVGNVSAPGQIAVNQLATTDLSAYMNPYTQEVINRTARDIGSAQQQAMNQLGAQAAAARAFGGSRQAVAESLTNQQFIDQLARTSADLRARGFETALQAGQFDIGQTQAARSLASQQQMQANQLNQQAAEMAAAREQAVRAGNVAAANQFATQQAQLQQAANQTNFGGQFQTAGVRAGAAGQLAGLGQQMFGQGQDITRQQQEFGLLQQGINQALIDAARGQYGGFAGAPQTAISLPLAAVGGANMGQQTQTERYSPGLFQYLTAGANIARLSDRRLKTNINRLGEHSGIKIYSWDWNEDGKRIADLSQPTVGVMADELMQTHPHLVMRGSDGYLRVNYGGLLAEIGGSLH